MWLVSLFALSASTAGAAAIVTVNASDFAPATNVSSAIEGVTLTRLQHGTDGSGGYNPIRQDVSTVDCSPRCAPESGATSFGGFGNILFYDICFRFGAPGACGDGFIALEIAFDSPVDYFQMTGGWFSDGPMLIAYDSDDNMLSPLPSSLGTCMTQWSPGQDVGTCDWVHWGDISTAYYTSMSFQMDSRAISRVIVGGFSSAFEIQQFSYSIPEPGTLLLLGSGLAFLGFTRRRSRQASLGHRVFQAN